MNGTPDASRRSPMILSTSSSSAMGTVYCTVAAETTRLRGEELQVLVCLEEAWQHGQEAFFTLNRQFCSAGGRVVNEDAVRGYRAASTSTAASVGYRAAKKAPGFGELWMGESRLSARGGSGGDHRLSFLEGQCWVWLPILTFRQQQTASAQSTRSRGR